MACPLTQNYVNKDCATVAGIVKVYLTPFANLLTSTVASNVVTVITKTLPWKTIDQEPEIANWKYTTPGSGEKGTLGFDWELSVSMVGLNTLDQVELETIAKNKLVFIVEMNDGNFWMLGRTYGGRLSNDAFDSGTKFDDEIGSKVTFKGRSSTKMLKVDSTVMAGLLS